MAASTAELLKNATYGVPLASTDATHAAAAFVEDQWGGHGYRLGAVSNIGSRTIFGVRSADGGEMFIWVDQHGNAGHVH